MIKEILVLSIFLFLLICPNVFPFQFEDYKWGSSYVENLQKVEASNKIIIERDENSITYYDELVDSSCRVKLGFTPKDKLAAIVIEWEDETVDDEIEEIIKDKHKKPASIGDEMKKIIKNKYGKPTSIDEGKNKWRYSWVENNMFPPNDGIVLKKDDSRITLIYISGKYKDEYKIEERAKAKKSDSSKF